MAALQGWPPRRWLTAAIAAALAALVVAVPTDLVDTPLFHRDVPPTWWDWPALGVSALLGGLLVATYVADPTDRPDDTADRSARRGTVAGVLTFFAVGCPVCNKLVLLAVGYTGALTWFQPFQPVLQLVALALLLWALATRLNGAVTCAVPVRVRSTPSPTEES